MIEKIDGVVSAISGFLYQPYIVPLILVAAGLYFTIRTGLIQFSLFGESVRVVSEKPKDKRAVSSFGALMVSTASRVGTGNIIGVSTAICLGGFGAIFWMWITAILGGASAFVESTLAQIYKKRDKDGTSYGGPSYYMQDALKQRWLGVIFAVVLILTYAVGYNMLASFNTQDTFSGFGFYDKKTTPIIIGAILAALFAVCVLGGGRRLTKITGVLVPVMGVIYVLVSLLVIIMNISAVPTVIKNIFVSAFDFEAVFGGFAGSCVMWGIKRGLYSNEAGMGSAPNAAATAEVSHPAKQGLVQMLSVFIDTLLICSATALMCMCANPDGLGADVAGAAYVQQCFSVDENQENYTFEGYIYNNSNVDIKYVDGYFTLIKIINRNSFQVITDVWIDVQNLPANEYRQFTVILHQKDFDIELGDIDSLNYDLNCFEVQTIKVK